MYTPSSYEEAYLQKCRDAGAPSACAATSNRQSLANKTHKEVSTLVKKEYNKDADTASIDGITGTISSLSSSNKYASSITTPGATASCGRNISKSIASSSALSPNAKQQVSPSKAQPDMDSIPSTKSLPYVHPSAKASTSVPSPTSTSASPHIATDVQVKLRSFLSQVHRELSKKPSDLIIFTELLNTR